jgi:hypothetical protein
MDKWFYAEGTERKGPVSAEELADITQKGQLGPESYIWKKGLEGWVRLKTVPEFASFLINSSKTPALKKGVDWQNISHDKPLVTIKIGKDRGLAEEQEYGPYPIAMIIKLFKEKRINAKTMFFIPEMENWDYLANIPIYESLFGEKAPVLAEDDRRRAVRKPFVAKMFLTDSKEIFEGVCRDVSVGGMQVLVAGRPGKVGQTVSINVHPDNGQNSFAASGTIVRFLDGDSGLSLRFDTLNEEAHKAIESYLSGS